MRFCRLKNPLATRNKQNMNIVAVYPIRLHARQGIKNKYKIKADRNARWKYGKLTNNWEFKKLLSTTCNRKIFPCIFSCCCFRQYVSHFRKTEIICSRQLNEVVFVVLSLFFLSCGHWSNSPTPRKFSCYRNKNMKICSVWPTLHVESTGSLHIIEVKPPLVLVWVTGWKYACCYRKN